MKTNHTECYQIFEDECEALLSVDDVMKCHDVGVFEVLQ